MSEPLSTLSSKKGSKKVVQCWETHFGASSRFLRWFLMSILVMQTFDGGHLLPSDAVFSPTRPKVKKAATVRPRELPSAGLSGAGLASLCLTVEKSVADDSWGHLHFYNQISPFMTFKIWNDHWSPRNPDQDEIQAGTGTSGPYQYLLTLNRPITFLLRELATKYQVWEPNLDFKMLIFGCHQRWCFAASSQAKSKLRKAATVRPRPAS